MSLRRAAVCLLVGFGVGAAWPAAAAPAEDPGVVTIPVDFEVNGRSAGQVVVRAQPDLTGAAIQGRSLKSAIGDRLTPTATEGIAELSDDFMLIEDLRARGIDLVLDLERLVVVLTAGERVRATEPTRGSFRMGALNELRPDLRLPEATVSGFTNIRVQKTLQADAGRGAAPTPLTADMQHVLNVRGWALAVDTLVSSERNRRGSSWSVGDVVLTHDVPARALRWKIGDFSTPVGMFQSGARMGGISLSREFTIQPYENFQPTGTAAFELHEPATVEVYLNGMRMRTLKLEAGTFNIEDFNLAAGANELELHITSASGRFERINLTQFTARTLLRRGVSEFALSAGFPTAADQAGAYSLGDEPWLDKHYDRDAMATGFLRHGISGTLTGELNLQGTAYWQRASTGFDLASRVGTFELYGSVHRHRVAGSAGSFSAAWENGVGPASIRLSSAYTGAGFTQTTPSPGFPARLAWSHAATVSSPLPGGFDATASAFYQTARGSGPTWGCVARGSRRFGSWSVSLALQSRRTSGRTDTGGFVTISWMQQPSWSVRSVVGAGAAAVNPGSSTEVSYTRRDGSRFFFADAGVESDDEGEHYRGGVRFQDNHLLAEIAHRQAYGSVFGQEQRTSETVGTLETAIAFADGAWGWTRRVDDGFAIVTMHPRWHDVDLGIDAAFGGFDYTVRPPLRSAVLSHLRAYRESTSFIQTIGSDRVLDQSDYVVFPTYRRGTRVVIGSDAIYTVRGTLLGTDGKAIAYGAITLSSPGAPEISAFTNIAGRFVAGPLTPGRWRVSVSGSRAWAEFLVDGEATFVRLETLALQPAD